jgi:hypothetical protein
MKLTEHLDAFIEEAVVELLDPEAAAYLLLSEDFRFTQLGEDVSILNEAHRIRVKVAGGGYMTKRVIGRKDPRRSRSAKRAALKGKAKRRMALRNPRSRMKRARTLAARKRLMGNKTTRRPKRRVGPTPRKRPSYRGYHGAKRHAAPRKAPRPKVRRPTFSRPKVRRPTVRRAPRRR